MLRRPNCRLITYQSFGLTNFEVRASVRWFIRLPFFRSLNTRHESWSDTVAICFALPLFLARNTDFSARRRTTWWNGKVTSIRVCASRFTVFTGIIASRRRKCWKTWMFCSVDLQDVGSRYYTFIWTLYLCMRACETCGTTVIVLDRPEPDQRRND